MSIFGFDAIQGQAQSDDALELITLIRIDQDPSNSPENYELSLSYPPHLAYQAALLTFEIMATTKVKSVTASSKGMDCEDCSEIFEQTFNTLMELVTA